MGEESDVSLFHIHDFPPASDSFWETRPILTAVLGALMLPLVPLAVWTIGALVRAMGVHDL